MIMNYKVENNLDFYAELNEALITKPDISNIEQNSMDNICLITHEPLINNHIILTCKHKFNYIPLYWEVVNQKSSTYLEITHLLVNQIKCPYCRTITNKLLPYIEYSGISLRRGVNYPLKYCMKLYSCTWVIKSGKKKGDICDNEAHKGEFGIYCNKHNKLCYQKLVNINKSKATIIWTEKHEELNIKYKIIDLKQILRANKLKIGGIKRELIDRIIFNSSIKNINIE